MCVSRIGGRGCGKGHCGGEDSCGVLCREYLNYVVDLARSTKIYTEKQGGKIYFGR